MKRYLLSFFLLLSPILLFAQKREKGYVFKASELMQVSARLVGDSTAWQIVVASAERRTSDNEFLLSASAQNILRTFSKLREKVNRERTTLSRLVKRGAVILAEPEFLKTTKALQAHDQAVADGNIATALQEGETFLYLLPTLSKLVDARRTEAVEAKLQKKTGTVDKRKGLLGLWQSAQEDDLFSESDAIRTGTSSTASLTFIDGSQILIDPATTAVVRASRLDKIDRTVNANITLIKGSLLSQLSKQAQESGSFKLSAGSSEAIVRSGKFWANVSEASATKISNYDGTLEVKSGEAVITLKKNQGTVILKGKEPIPPVELLPAPRLQWNGLDTVIFQETLLLTWNPVPNTAKYQIEISSERDFSRNVRVYSTSARSLSLAKLSEKTCFVRLQAIDRFGLRGADSPTYRILRTPDREPPFIFIQDFSAQSIDTLTRYTTLSQLNIRGETEPNTRLFKDGEPIAVSQDGTFQVAVSLENLSEKFVSLSAFDAANNQRKLTLRFVPIRQAQLYPMTWNCKSIGDTLISRDVPIQVYGVAYPNLSLFLTHGNKTYSATADAKGNWAIAVQPLANQSLTVSFESPDSKQRTQIRTYFVK
ncbi:MAG: FecR domain-containing protein [Chloroherpetonaceae bacterium]